MDYPSVAVVLSYYNGSRFIKEQIDSILKQANVKIDLYIRNDGSTNLSDVSFLESFISVPNIKIFNCKNVGVGNSFMNMLYAIDGTYDYYCFADQDDIWLPDKVYKAVLKIKEIRKPALYVSNQSLVDSNSNFISFRHTGRINVCLKQIINNNILSGCTMLWNSFLNDILVNDRFKPSPELLKNRIHDVWVAAVAVCVGQIIYDENSYILYRQHENNVVGVRKENKLKLYIKKFKNKSLRNGRSLLASELLMRFEGYLSQDNLFLLNEYSKYRKSLSLKMNIINDIELRKITGESKFEIMIKVIFHLF